MELDKEPRIGQIVKILRGRDSGCFAVIVGLEDQRFALIADGNTRKFDHPKKKNLHHLELQNEISEIVVSSLSETGRVTNGKLRHALAKYTQSLDTETQAKGE